MDEASVGLDGTIWGIGYDYYHWYGHKNLYMWNFTTQSFGEPIYFGTDVAAFNVSTIGVVDYDNYVQVSSLPAGPTPAPT